MPAEAEEDAQLLQFCLRLVSINPDPLPGMWLVLNWKFILCLLEVCKNTVKLSGTGRDTTQRNPSVDPLVVINKKKKNDNYSFSPNYSTLVSALFYE